MSIEDLMFTISFKCPKALKELYIEKSLPVGSSQLDAYKWLLDNNYITNQLKITCGGLL